MSPLLDGLDEVAEEHRQACVTAINDFPAERGATRIVVCCRTADYERLRDPLRTYGTLTIQPLTRNQVEAFLARAGEPVAAVRAALAMIGTFILADGIRGASKLRHELFDMGIIVGVAVAAGGATQRTRTAVAHLVSHRWITSPPGSRGAVTPAGPIIALTAPERCGAFNHIHQRKRRATIDLIRLTPPCTSVMTCARS
ncbi:MAG: hypothetical protein M3460_03425 [Actinomycetota bacterium]|nr:hypothetical protein [Actinomycetota bacterium]